MHPSSAARGRAHEHSRQCVSFCQVAPALAVAIKMILMCVYAGVNECAEFQPHWARHRDGMD